MKTVLATTIAATTTASGATLLSEGSYVSVGLFVAGVSAIVGVAFYLGSKANEVTRMGKSLMEFMSTTTRNIEAILERLRAVELEQAANGRSNAATQRIIVEDEPRPQHKPHHRR
jgi:hypothetical protein